jgi:hypothetical protein
MGNVPKVVEIVRSALPALSLQARGVESAKKGNAMKKDSISARLVAPGIETAWENVTASFERFCLTAGIATLTEMMEQDAVELCGTRHERGSDRRGYR